MPNAEVAAVERFGAVVRSGRELEPAADVAERVDRYVAGMSADRREAAPRELVVPRALVELQQSEVVRLVRRIDRGVHELAPVAGDVAVDRDEVEPVRR